MAVDRDHVSQVRTRSLTPPLTHTLLPSPSLSPSLSQVFFEIHCETDDGQKGQYDGNKEKVWALCWNRGREVGVMRRQQGGPQGKGNRTSILPIAEYSCTSSSRASRRCGRLIRRAAMFFDKTSWNRPMERKRSNHRQLSRILQNSE